jgi:hypothetical protein
MKNRLEMKRQMKRMLEVWLVFMTLVLLPTVGSAAIPTFISSSSVLEIDGSGAFTVQGGINPADYQSGGQYNAGIVKWDQVSFTAFNNFTGVGGYDTVVLFQAKTTDLNGADKSILVDFVKNGGKLIIWDAEGGDVGNYSWLPTNLFFESLPGLHTIEHGGILQITEENDLSSNISSNPKFIDTNALAVNTDAVRDANVVVNNGTDWCRDMFGESVNAAGSVHMYSILGGSAEKGFIVYSGLDWNSAGKFNQFFDPATGGQRKKMLQFELEVSNSSNLPCRVQTALRGSITGIKFEDINANHIFDSGEPGLPGWTITLIDNDTGVTTNQTTVSDGSYNFTNLADGNYTVGEVLQNGWIQTVPLNSSTIKLQISAGNVVRVTNATHNDFGNFKLGEIKGEKFNDVNGNGVKDAGDLGIPGWQVNIVGTDTLKNTVVNQTVTTDPSGKYDITGLTPGTYTITEVMQPGYIQTAPGLSTSGSASYTVIIENSSTVIVDKDFGNFKFGEIHGTKFEDLNVNGIKDQGDTGLKGWQININGTDTITNTVVNKTTITDINGDYNFTGLTNGTYTITEVAQNNWVQSAPATGKYTVIITSGAVITKQDFGNFHKGKITGGGWISIKGDPKATFGIVGQYPDGNTAQGNVEYQDHKANLNIKSIQINTVATTLDNKKGSITGLAQVNGAGSYPFVVYVEDNGEPGKDIDVFNISLPTYTYSNGDILNGGNIQIHS